MATDMRKEKTSLEECMVEVVDILSFCVRNDEAMMELQDTLLLVEVGILEEVLDADFDNLKVCTDLEGNMN